jgi:hypothetical protein
MDDDNAQINHNRTTKTSSTMNSTVASSFTTTTTTVEPIVGTSSSHNSTVSWWPALTTTTRNNDASLHSNATMNGTPNDNRNVHVYYNYFSTNYVLPLTTFVTTASEKYISTLHPGHCCMITGIPLLLHAYYGYYNYHSSSEQLVQDIIRKQQSIIRALPPPLDVATAAVADVPPHLLEESIRRSIGVAVASRALRVATTGTLGIFSISMGLLFYSTQTSSVTQIVQILQQSSRKHCQTWQQSIHTLFRSSNNAANSLQVQPYDENHPEYKKVQAMTEEEELEYIYQTYIQEQLSSEHNSDESKS